MSIESNHFNKSSSPANSGRSSPANHRVRLLDEEGSIRKDKNYRRYAMGVERALSLFDTALQEWADYISFLTRLLKALQVRPNNSSTIPHKTLVSKRLAQCLNPTLPPGVHQKTLELYSYIFTVLKKDGLGRDLSLYLPGLSPVLSFASLSVKPALLSIFENFILALDPTVLHPAFKAVIIAVLPGLEDESSEEFERTCGIINKLKDVVDEKTSVEDALNDQYFWQCFFLASITVPSRRQGALSYLVRTLPKLGIPLEPNYDTPGIGKTSGNGTGKGHLSLVGQSITSPEPGLLVRCFAAGLCDEQHLIQRGFLDLLVTHLPLHSEILHTRVTPEDLEKLVSAAASVVTRREMSLNRRLWVWLLGPDTLGSQADKIGPNDNNTVGYHHERIPSRYFSRYGLSPIVAGLHKSLTNDLITPSAKARPFRICLSLMDRWEIGSLVIPRVFLESLQSVWRYQKAAPSKEAFAEVFLSANMFFDGIESSLIWSEINKTLATALRTSLSDLSSAQNSLDLVVFIITRFNIREEEMLVKHVPITILHILLCIRIHQTQSALLSKELSHLHKIALTICSQLVDLVPRRAFQTEQENQISSNLSSYESTAQAQTLTDTIHQYYDQLQWDAKEKVPTPLDHCLGRHMIDQISLIVMHDLDAQEQASNLELKLTIFNKIVSKLSISTSLEWGKLLFILSSTSKTLATQDERLPSFHAIAAILSALETISSVLPVATKQADHRFRQIMPYLITCLWFYLSPSMLQFNVEAARYILRIQRFSYDENIVESAVTTLMGGGIGSNQQKVKDVEAARRFVNLWTHAVPISSPSQGRFPEILNQTFKPDLKRQKSGKDTFMLARPLIFLLDSLSCPDSEVFLFTVSWIKTVPSVHIIVDFIINRLQGLLPLQDGFLRAQNEGSNLDDGSKAYHDVEECIYYFEVLSNLMQYSMNSIWPTLMLEIPNTNYESYKQADQANDKEVVKEGSARRDLSITVQMYLSRSCLGILQKPRQNESSSKLSEASLSWAAAKVLHQMIIGLSSHYLWEPEIEKSLIKALTLSVNCSDVFLQKQLMDLTSLVLKHHVLGKSESSPRHNRNTSRDTIVSVSQRSLSIEKPEKEQVALNSTTAPSGLLDCLILGFSSPNTQAGLENWVQFLDDCLPLYGDGTFQILIPLVDCFIKTIEFIFSGLQGNFGKTQARPTNALEPVITIITLLNGLEQVLARAHEQLSRSEVASIATKPTEQAQRFFGNMVSGVFTSDTYRSKTLTANNRLTVLLCCKDTVRLGLNIWTWGDMNLESSKRDSTTMASFNYTSLRMKNRVRRILEHLFAAEALECLETLIESWFVSDVQSSEPKSSAVFSLLHALDGSRPRNTIPAIFDAMYSRSNPQAIEPTRKSTLTSDLSDLSLAHFLVLYSQSLEDDAMDEIWVDCVTFLRDVLTNPLPHRQTLPKLLEFAATLGEKVDNTNFGEQRKMRRELGDLFVRVLAATFTIKPLSFSNELLHNSNANKLPNDSLQSSEIRKISLSTNIIEILASISPKLSKILVDSDHITIAATTISTQVLAPTFRWKSYPQNMTQPMLDIIYAMSRIPEASKIWRKDVAEAFNDPKFFCVASLHLADKGWLPVLRQWLLLDKDRIPEFLVRLSSPTSAGIMFGVGASSARLEADRKTQQNLRRLVVLVLAGMDDAFVADLLPLQNKLVDLMSATAASSPSSVTRAEIFMLLRGLVLKTSPIHLTSFWPIVNSELRDALSSLFPDENHDTYNAFCIVQACKLLETLLIIAPDEFQMGEWLFITDTIDAVYRPADWDPIALVDELAEELDSKAGILHSGGPSANSTIQSGARKPLLTATLTRDVPKEDLVNRVLHPFFRQLSINTFENTYSMEAPDWQACYDELLIDVFDESTIV